MPSRIPLVSITYFCHSLIIRSSVRTIQLIIVLWLVLPRTMDRRIGAMKMVLGQTRVDSHVRRCGVACYICLMLWRYCCSCLTLALKLLHRLFCTLSRGQYDVSSILQKHGCGKSPSTVESRGGVILISFSARLQQTSIREGLP